MRALWTLVLPVLALSASGCAPRARLWTPDGFATLETESGDRYDYRATTPDGVVIAARVEKNEPRGNLDFWVGALDRQLRRSGYELLDVPGGVKVATSSGLEGRELRYSRDQGNGKQSFTLAVFVVDEHVVIVEAGGMEAQLDEATRARVQKAIQTLAL